MKIAEHDLLPAAAAHPDAVVLADGFSCRTQLAELAGREAVTLAELLVTHPVSSNGQASRVPTPRARPSFAGSGTTTGVRSSSTAVATQGLRHDR